MYEDERRQGQERSPGSEAAASAVTEEASEILRIEKDTLAELVSEHSRLSEILKEFHLDRARNTMQLAKASARA